MAPQIYQGEQTTTDEDLQIDPEVMKIKGTEQFKLPDTPLDGSEQEDIDPNVPAPETKPKESGGPKTTDPGSDPVTLETKKEFRFKTHEQAEKSYKEQQRFVTELSEENKRLKSEKDMLEKKEAEKAEQEKRAQESRKAYKEFAVERRKKLMLDVENLDSDDDDYVDKVADLQADTDLEIKEFTYEPPAVQPPTGTPPAPTGPGTTPDNLVMPEDGELSPTEVLERLQTKQSIEEQVSNMGINLEDPNYSIFAYYAGSAPKMDLEDQIQWAVNKTRSHIALSAADPDIKEDDPVFSHFIVREPVKDDKGNPISIEEQASQAIKKTKLYHEERKSKILSGKHAPLGKGTAVPAGGIGGDKTTARKVSIDSAIDRANEKRRI